MAISTCLSIITLNANELNLLIKRHKVAEWIIKIRPIYILPTRDSPQKSGHTQTVKGRKKIFHANGNVKKPGIVISDKIGFKTKTIIKDKEGH